MAVLSRLAVGFLPAVLLSACMSDTQSAQNAPATPAVNLPTTTVSASDGTVRLFGETPATRARIDQAISHGVTACAAFLHHGIGLNSLQTKGFVLRRNIWGTPQVEDSVQGVGVRQKDGQECTITHNGSARNMQRSATIAREALENNGFALSADGDGRVATRLIVSKNGRDLLMMVSAPSGGGSNFVTVKFEK